MQRVAERARATERDPAEVFDEVLRAGFEALDSAEDAAIALGDAEVARGAVVEHGEAMRRLDALLGRIGPRPQ
jgi:predicted transcriptional regulator